MAFLALKTGLSLVLKTGPSFFFFTVCPHCYSVFWVFLKTQSHCAKIVFLQNFGDVKNEVLEKIIAFFVFFLFYVGEIETEKKKKKENGKGPNTL